MRCVWTQININKKKRQKNILKWSVDTACGRVGAWMRCVFLRMRMVDGGVDALRVCADALRADG